MAGEFSRFVELCEVVRQTSINNCKVTAMVPMSFRLADVMFSSQEVEEFYKKPLA